MDSFHGNFWFISFAGASYQVGRNHENASMVRPQESPQATHTVLKSLTGEYKTTACVGDVYMDVGTTVEVEFNRRSEGYFKAEHDGNRFSIAGEGSVGDTCNIRVVKKQENTFIGVTEGASLRLRIDEVIDNSTAKAYPSYGPVLIQAPLICGDWWQCIVTGINKNHITAKNTMYIPRNSDIPNGPPPKDPTQSLNELISDRKP